MDQGGGAWGENGTTDHNTLTTDLEGEESSHQYFCPIYVGGVCACSVGEQTNNNDYTKFKKSSKSKGKTKFKNFCDEQSQYGSPYCDPRHPQQFDRDGYTTSTDYTSYSSSPSYTPQPTSHYEQQDNSWRECAYCHSTPSGVSGSYRDCAYCSAHQRSSCNSHFNPSMKHGSRTNGHENSFTQPKIQVTAKLLFGTVSAITDIKQKNSAKKN